MEKKGYSEVIDGYHSIQFMVALKKLIEYGRLNFLDDNFYKEMREKSVTGIYEPEFYTEIIDLAREMAELPLYDLYELMEDKIYLIKMAEPRENKSQQKEKKEERER